MRPWPRGLVAVAVLALASCGTAPPKRGGYYQNDGPPDRAAADPAATPDAVPRVEPVHPRANRPYTALGGSYVPLTGDVAFRQRGLASWYGKQFHGNRTASGEIYDMMAMTAAHPTLPIPSYVRVTALRSGRSVIVRVNDRGPFNSPRLIDLSYAAAKQLEMVDSGEARVRLELINDTPDQMVIMEPMKPIEMTPTTPAAAAPNTMSQDGFLGEPTALAMATPAADPAPVKAPAAAPVKAAPIKPASAKAAAPASSGDGKMIQVLASGSQERAEAMGKVMTQRYGVPYRVDAHGAIFRVLIGPVAADQQASVLEKVRQGGLEQAFIVP